MMPFESCDCRTLQRTISLAFAASLVACCGCNNLVRINVDADVDADGSDTICTADGAECGAGFFCLFDEGTCDDADRVGSCEATPEICTEEFAPVCGCDGETYSNECFAMASGVSIDQQGECS